jgi:hypothetical protein
MYFWHVMSRQGLIRSRCRRGLIGRRGGDLVHRVFLVYLVSRRQGNDRPSTQDKLPWPPRLSLVRYASHLPAPFILTDNIEHSSCVIQTPQGGLALWVHLCGRTRTGGRGCDKNLAKKPLGLRCRVWQDATVASQTGSSTEPDYTACGRDRR